MEARLAALRFRRLLLPMLILLALLGAGHPPARAQQALPVDALRGRLGEVEGRPYRHTLTAEDGQVYALLGAVPEVEAQIAAFARDGAMVEVAGSVQPSSPLTEGPLVVATSVIRLDGPGAATSTPTFTPTAIPTSTPTYTPTGTPAPTATPTATIAPTLPPTEIPAPAAPPTSPPPQLPDDPTPGIIVPDPGLNPAPRPTIATLAPDQTPLGRATAVAGQATRAPASTPAATATALGAATPLLAATASPTVTLVPSFTPAPAPAPGPQVDAALTVFAVNLRKGPGSDYAAAGVLRADETCTVAGRSAQPGWLLLECAEVGGWVRSGFVEVTGELALVPPLLVNAADTAAPEAPTPAAAPFRWRALAYTNRSLSGPPAVGFDTAVIDFDWGFDAPLAGFPVDNFSIRFDAIPRFAPGDYLFRLTYDDGARLVVDGEVVINDWNEGPARTSTWQGRLAGDVPVRVEYFEAFHEAMVRLEIGRIVAQAQMGAAATMPPPSGALPNVALPEEAWLATYFANPTRAGLPALVREEPADDAPALTRSSRAPLNRTWGLTSPAPTVLGLEGWSARWQGNFYFAGGAHSFDVTGSGAARLYIDGLLVAAGALSDEGLATGEDVTLAPGLHAVVVEFAGGEDGAAVRVAWQAREPGDETPDAAATAAAEAPPATRTPAPTRPPGLPPLPAQSPAPPPLLLPTPTPSGK
jgi:hypothetical protein